MNNKVSIRGVQVGDRIGEMWVVNSGVSAGDRVVTEGIDKVRDGMTVNPLVEKTDPAAQSAPQNNAQPNTPAGAGR
jgi:membrane fusion protein, multidrug efflux system